MHAGTLERVLAMTTARVLTRSPLDNFKVKLPGPSVCARSALTSSGIAISAPNFCAWL
jgi:hypothetical protein